MLYKLLNFPSHLKFKLQVNKNNEAFEFMLFIQKKDKLFSDAGGAFPYVYWVFYCFLIFDPFTLPIDMKK